MIVSRSFLAALLVTIASSTLVLGQQATHQPVEQLRSSTSAEPYSELLKRFRETEARLESAEKRLAENEERWSLVGSSAGNDVENTLGLASNPIFSFSGHSGERASGYEQFVEPVIALQECACPPPYCDRCLTRLSWNKNGYRITPFGSVAGESILTDSSTTARAFVRYINPDTGFDDSQSTITGQGSAFGLNIDAPRIGEFEARGLFYFKFYGGQPAQNLPGLFYLLGFGELRNENWRFVFGHNLDLIGPLQLHTLNFTAGLAGGNIGLATTRGQLRAEHFIHPREDVQWTIQTALTQQFLPDFTADPEVNGTDNGWPNVEGRIALGFGEDFVHPLSGPLKPIEFGVSGLIGETRVTKNLVGPRVSTTWAVVADAKFSTAEWGIQGEFFAGEALGSYGGGIDQSANLANGFAIYSTGGWGEVWHKVLPCVTAHAGYGIDDPRDSDLSAGQRSRNEFYFGNLIWDVTERFQLGFEVSHWKTDYAAPLVDNSSMVYHFKTELFY